MCKFAPDDFKNDKPLGGEFLLASIANAPNYGKGKNEEPEEMQLKNNLDRTFIFNILDGKRLAGIRVPPKEFYFIYHKGYLPWEQQRV